MLPGSTENIQRLSRPTFRRKYDDRRTQNALILAEVRSGLPTPSNGSPVRHRPSTTGTLPTASSGSPARLHLQPVARPNRVALTLIRGVDHVRDILHENTLRFAEGFAANNVLLWGARGMGKSSLVKAVHEDVRRDSGVSLKLVEVHREDICQPADPARHPEGRAASRHRLLRRPFLRSRRYRLQVAEGGARRRCRRPAGQCAVLRHIQPPPPAAASHDGERAIDGDQSIGSRRGKGVAFRPLRPLARLPQMQPGRLSADDRRLCRSFQA